MTLTLFPMLPHLRTLVTSSQGIALAVSSCLLTGLTASNSHAQGAFTTHASHSLIADRETEAAREEVPKRPDRGALVPEGEPRPLPRTQMLVLASPLYR